jgi:hypothetical protein
VNGSDEYGIICNEKNVTINIIFEVKENAYKFQSAIRIYTRKRSSEEVQLFPRLENEAISTISSSGLDLIRIMAEDYKRVADGSDEYNSPEYSVTQHSHSHSESLSQHTVHYQNPLTNPELSLQMIEPIESSMFKDQIAEACHLQPKVNDPNNFLYLSRYFHQHLDGIDCPNPNVPNMLIHYVAHNSIPEQTPVPNITAYRTTIQIFFRNIDNLHALVHFLKDGGFIQDINGKRAYQLDLFFENGVKAREYLKHKELSTIKIWNEKASDNSFDFLAK